MTALALLAFSFARAGGRLRTAAEAVGRGAARMTLAVEITKRLGAGVRAGRRA